MDSERYIPSSIERKEFAPKKIIIDFLYLKQYNAQATSYKVKNGLLKMAFSDEPISNKIF